MPFALAVADQVVDALRDDSVGHRLALEALELARHWLRGDPVRGEELAVYIDDPDEDKDLGLREGLYDDEPTMIGALAVITIAVGLTAAAAYDSEGGRLRPTAIWETTPRLVPDMVEFAIRTGRCSREQLERWAEHT